MSRNKNKKEALRAQQLKRKITLLQRDQLFKDIKSNTDKIDVKQHELIQSNIKKQTKQTERKTISFKEKAGIQITEKEKSKIYKQLTIVDSDAAQIVDQQIQIDFPDQPTENIIPEEVKLVDIQTVQERYYKHGDLIQEPSYNESSNSDPLAQISSFPEKYQQISDNEQQIREHSSTLPVSLKIFEIFEALENTDILILSAATGTGKSTQIPQYLLSKGYGINKPGFYNQIFVTQPRRIAAVSLAKRVGEEWQNSSEISFAVRNQSNINKNTKVTYMTEGVLLQMLKNDPLLSKVSCIILDEAHERSQQMDCCLGLLQRIVEERRKIFNSLQDDQKIFSSEEYQQRFNIQPLKLIIMSATLQHSNYKNLDKALTVKLDQKAYPVSIHFEPSTPTDIVQAAVEKVIHVHKKYPPGAILVFLTGQAEVKKCCKLIEDELSTNIPLKQQPQEDNEESHEDEMFDFTQKITNQNTIEEHESFNDSQLNTIEYAGELNEDVKKQIIELETEFKAPKQGFELPKEFTILPLYGALPLEQQQLIYQTLDKKTNRLIVIATNVAESSITVPSVRYVIDACKLKEKTELNEIIQLQEIYASQANLQQRSGRAGRTCPGHAFRLISPAKYTQLLQFQTPEIQRIGLEQTCLLLIRIGVSDPRNFTWPGDFNNQLVPKALDRLLQLGALIERQNQPFLTKFGKKLSDFPVSLPAAVLVTISDQTLNLMAAAVIQSGILEANTKPFPVKTGKGDFFDGIFTFGAFLRYDNKQKQLFCDKNELLMQKFVECEKVYYQLGKLVGKGISELERPGKPSKLEMDVLHLSILRLYLKNIGTADVQKVNRYNVKQFDVREYCNDQTEIIQRFLEKTPYMEKAYLNKQSNLINQEAGFVVYKEVDLKIKIFENQVRPQVMLRCVHPFKLVDLLPLAEFSPILDVSLPVSFSLNADQEIMAVVDVYYDQIHIGQINTRYPGKKAVQEFLDSEFLINKARIVALMRGDYQVKIKSRTSLKIEFDKGMFSMLDIDKAAQLLKAKGKDFWRNSELINQIQSILQ